MKLVTDMDTITRAELHTMSEKMYGNLVKAVVDINKGIMVVDADMHADQAAFLLNESESELQHLWGIILHPKKFIDAWIEFDSLINVRSPFVNRSRHIEDACIREKITGIVTKLVQQ